jgi:hypothetical protein
MRLRRLRGQLRPRSPRPAPRATFRAPRAAWVVAIVGSSLPVSSRYTFWYAAAGTSDAAAATEAPIIAFFLASGLVSVSYNRSRQFLSPAYAGSKLSGQAHIYGKCPERL